MFSWLLCNLNMTLDVSLITPHIKPGWTLGPGASCMKSYWIASSMFHQLNPCRFWLQLISSDPSRARSSNIFPDLSKTSRTLRRTPPGTSRKSFVKLRFVALVMTGHDRPIERCRGPASFTVPGTVQMSRKTQGTQIFRSDYVGNTRGTLLACNSID